MSSLTSTNSVCGYWASSNDKIYWYFWPKFPYPLTNIWTVFTLLNVITICAATLDLGDAQKNDKFNMITSLSLLFYIVWDQLWFKFTLIEKKFFNLGWWSPVLRTLLPPLPPLPESPVPLTPSILFHRLLLLLPHNLLLLPFLPLALPFCFHKFRSKALSFRDFNKFTSACPTKPERKNYVTVYRTLFASLPHLSSWIPFHCSQFLSPKYPSSCPLRPRRPPTNR